MTDAPAPPVNPKALAWAAQQAARFDALQPPDADAKALFAIVDETATDRPLLRKIAPDVDSTISESASRAYQRITGRTLSGTQP